MKTNNNTQTAQKNSKGAAQTENPTSLADCIKKGKDLAADCQWAISCMNDKLMDKYAEKKRQLDLWVMSHFSDDEICEYFRALD